MRRFGRRQKSSPAENSRPSTSSVATSQAHTKRSGYLRAFHSPSSLSRTSASHPLRLSVHSAFRTVSNSSTQTVVNITSYPASIWIHPCTAARPVRRQHLRRRLHHRQQRRHRDRAAAAAAAAAPGSRARSPSAAKNVPFTTSAHVPSGIISHSSHTSPSGCRL